MNTWLETFLKGDVWGGALDPQTIALIMATAFAIGLFMGFIYMWTHDAISYSRTFVGALAMLPLLVAMMLVAMAGSLTVAFGLLAVFGVIRFRNVLKDTRDTSFILWAVTEGVMVGSTRYSSAVVSSLGIAMAFIFLRLVSFGLRRRYDAILTLRLTGDPVARAAHLRQVLTRHASKLDLASERRVTNEGTDISYRLLLRDPARSGELQAELAGAEGFENVSVYMHDDEAEI